jgi:4-alpha-glucanotransferase
MPQEYRAFSIAVISTHDSATLKTWWETEAGTVDGDLFKRKCEERGIAFESIKEQLFDLSKSTSNRLRWKAVHSPDSFVRVLGREANQLADLIDLFKGTYEEKRKFWFYLGLSEPFQEKASPLFLKKAIEKINQTNSIFSIQLLQDWMSLDPSFDRNKAEDRINFPGQMRTTNWSMLMPFSLETMKRLSINTQIKQINAQAQRL